MDFLRNLFNSSAQNNDSGHNATAPASSATAHKFRDPATYPTCEDIQARIEACGREINRAQDDHADFHRLKQKNIDDIERLTAESLAGNVSAALSEELARKSKFVVDPFDSIFEGLMTEGRALREELGERQQCQAEDAYEQALKELAQVCARANLWPAFEKVKEAAEAAKVRLDATNTSDVLLTHNITVGGQRLGIGKYASTGDDE